LAAWLLLASLSPPAACVSLAARRSPRSPLPASHLSPAARPSGRPAAARRSRRRCRLAQKPVRDPGGGGRLGCSGLSRRPRPRAHPPSAAGGRRSLCFTLWRRRVRQQDASRVFPATRMLRAHVAFDCATAWTRLGVRVARGRRPRRRRRGWLACTAGGNFD
jgi:hypothetical protein